MVLVEDLEQMFVCIDENFARGERWIFRNFSLGEFFNFKGQNVGHFESFAGLKVLPIFSGIELLDERLGGMIALGNEFQERSVRQPFQSRLLRVAARYIADLFQVFVLDCVGRVSHWNLIEHPLIDRTGLRHGVRMLVRDQRLSKKFAHSPVDFAGSKIAVV